LNRGEGKAACRLHLIILNWRNIGKESKEIFLQREWGPSVQPLKKPTVPTVLAHRQFMDKNKQLTLLSQCKLALSGRKEKKTGCEAYCSLYLSI
jgi:hypothetical protein